MKRINILITDEQHKRLIEQSKLYEKTMSEQIRRAIDDQFKAIDSVVIPKHKANKIMEMWGK